MIQKSKEVNSTKYWEWVPYNKTSTNKIKRSIQVPVSFNSTNNFTECT